MNKPNDSSNIVPDKLKAELLGYALEIAERLRVKLDFSHKSVKKVEKILGKIHKEYKRTQNEEGMRGIALEFAAYIVAVIEKNMEKGRWERNHPDLGEDSFPYYWKDGTIFPFAWCMKRIYDGKGDNVWMKYKIIVMETKG